MTRFPTAASSNDVGDVLQPSQIGAATGIRGVANRSTPMTTADQDDADREGTLPLPPKLVETGQADFTSGSAGPSVTMASPWGPRGKARVLKIGSEQTVGG